MSRQCAECSGSGTVHVPNGLNSYSRRCSRGCETMLEQGARLLKAERAEEQKERDARIRRGALEEAAKLADERSRSPRGARRIGFEMLAAEIRALANGVKP